MSNRLAHRLFQPLAQKHLNQLAETPGVQALVLFSDDGHEVATHAVVPEVSGRLAAIGSSLAALGTALSAEAGLGEAQHTLVESRQGTILLIRLGSTPAYSLALIAQPDAVLGRLLWASKNCGQQLRELVAELYLASDRDTAA